MQNFVRSLRHYMDESEETLTSNLKHEKRLAEWTPTKGILFVSYDVVSECNDRKLC